MKRRQKLRRLTILVTVAIVAVSLGVGIYVLSTSKSALDAYINVPVSSSVANSLYHMSLQPYGPAPPSAMIGEVKSATGSAFVAGGKPVLVYIGGEFCPYCAVQRWSLIMALMRFGNFSDLRYMTSAASEGDLATFTFVGSTYQSNYLSFQPFENEDRNHGPLQSVPANYSKEWQSYSSVYPFENFGNKYILPGATMGYSDLSGKNWTTVLGDIRNGDSFGLQVKESANLMTALICKVTGNQPGNVCSVFPVPTTVTGIAAPANSAISIIPAKNEIGG
jgi:uncharacterized protein DUF929